MKIIIYILFLSISFFVFSETITRGNNIKTVPYDEKWIISKVNRANCRICTADMYLIGGLSINKVPIYGEIDLVFNENDHYTIFPNSDFGLGDTFISANFKRVKLTDLADLSLGTLCDSDQVPVFSCPIKHKSFSVCREDKKTVKYRYGVKLGVELELSNPIWSQRSQSGEQLTHLKFKNGQYSYVVYESKAKGKVKASGLKVYRGEKLISHKQCSKRGGQFAHFQSQLDYLPTEKFIP